MYATNTIIKHSKKAGKLIGTHQRINKVARGQFSKIEGKRAKFPNLKTIQYFEGTNGPDGIKRKSPGTDEPWMFIDPNDDDGKLISQIMDHHHNLAMALKKEDYVRASFEAAWMSHDIVDGLTPPHHYPYLEAVDDLKEDRDALSFFGIQTKGIMPGDTAIEILKNNWLYWGTSGLFTTHVAFEFGVAFVVSTTKTKAFSRMPTMDELEDLRKHGYKEMFYKSLEKVAKLDMYNRFIKTGWTTELALESKSVLVPEIVKCVTLAWVSAYEKNKK
jgi:hypothetical protein